MTVKIPFKVRLRRLWELRDSEDNAVMLAGLCDLANEPPDDPEVCAIVCEEIYSCVRMLPEGAERIQPLSVAESAIDKAISLQPKKFEYYLQKENVLYAMKRREDAMNVILAAEQKCALTPSQQLTVARHILDRGERINRQQKIVASDPQFVPAWMAMIKSFQKMGEFDKAIETTEAALEATNGHPRIRKVYALLLQGVGQVSRAKSELLWLVAFMQSGRPTGHEMEHFDDFPEYLYDRECLLTECFVELAKLSLAGPLEELATYLRKAVRLDTTDISSPQYQALAMISQGREAEARLFLKELW